jgi:hypothetical protein
MSYLDMARRVLKERKSEDTTKKRTKAPVCVECGAAIDPSEPETWWGLDRVHLDCVKAAWRREWKGKVLPAEAAAYAGSRIALAD